MSGVFCLWNGSLSVRYHVTASQAYVCAKVVSATETHVLQHRVDVIDSWAKGPLAPSWFSFSLEVSSGTWNSCYSISAEQLMAVMRMKSKLNTEPVFLFYAAMSFSCSSSPCVWFTLDISWKTATTLTNLLASAHKRDNWEEKIAQILTWLMLSTYSKCEL